MNEDWKILMNLIRKVLVIILVAVFFNTVRIFGINNLNAAELILVEESTLGGSASFIFLLLLLLHQMNKHLTLHKSNKEFVGIAYSADTLRYI